MSRDDTIWIKTQHNPDEILAIFLGDDVVVSRVSDAGEVDIETNDLMFFIRQLDPVDIEFTMERCGIPAAIEIGIFLDKFAGYAGQVALIMDRLLRLLKQTSDDLVYQADAAPKLVRQNGLLRVLNPPEWDYDYRTYLDIPFEAVEHL